MTEKEKRAKTLATNKKDNEDRKRISEPIAARPLRPQGLLFLQSRSNRPKGFPMPCAISPIYSLTWDVSAQASNLGHMQPQRSLATLFPNPKIYLFHRCNRQILRFLSPSRMPLRFASRQPISSGSTTSAGRQKKDWGRFWEGVVAMGLAL